MYGWCGLQRTFGIPVTLGHNLVRQLKADWFVTDDTAARVLATTLGIEVHGSLGILLWAAAAHLDGDEADAGSMLWLPLHFGSP